MATSNPIRISTILTDVTVWPGALDGTRGPDRSAERAPSRPAGRPARCPADAPRDPQRDAARTPGGYGRERRPASGPGRSTGHKARTVPRNALRAARRDTPWHARRMPSGPAMGCGAHARRIRPRTQASIRPGALDGTQGPDRSAERAPSRSAGYAAARSTDAPRDPQWDAARDARPDTAGTRRKLDRRSISRLQTLRSGGPGDPWRFAPLRFAAGGRIPTVAWTIDPG